MSFVNINKVKFDKKNQLQGFVTSIRNNSNICFLVLEDITGKIQVVIKDEFKKKIDPIINQITHFSVISVTGIVSKNPNVKLNGMEMILEKIEIVSVAKSPLPLDTTSLIDTRLDYRWIDLRNKKNQLLFKVRSCILNALRSFLLSKKFIEINTPKLIAAASESGSEVFTIDNYFGKKAYLAQSPQFYKQMCIAAGFERVFEIGAVFRAENSNSTRHATEFTGFDLEVAPIISVNEIMKLEQNLLISVFKKVKKQYGEQIKELYAIDLIVPNKPFPIIKLSELFKELTTRYKYQPTDQTDLSAEGEKLASKFAKEQYHSDFLFVTDYDKSVRPFYHYRNDKQIPQGFDLIYNGVEITSGAKREHRIDVLKKQAKEKNLEKDVKFYLEFFNYGIAPHGGFGLGVDRLVMLILGVNIREATLCFRGPDRLTP